MPWARPAHATRTSKSTAVRAPSSCPDWPGAWPISKNFDAIVCLGAIIRGATPHFDVVVNQTTRGIAQIAAEAKLAVGFGVLTCDTIEQAIERAGSKGGNRGADAAMAAIEMANLYDKLAARAESASAQPRHRK